MIRKAKLYARVNDEGTFRWTAVKFSKSGLAKDPEFITRRDASGKKDIVRITKGQIVSYGIRVKNNIKSVAEDLPTAEAKWREIQHQISGGVIQLPTPAPTTAEAARISIANAAQQYLTKVQEDVEKDIKAPATLVKYQKAVNDFQANCGVTFMDEVTADVILDHERWLRKNIKTRGNGHFQNTLASRFRDLRAFFAFYGIKLAKDRSFKPGDAGLLNRDDMPQERDIVDEEKAQGVRTYTDDDIKALLEVATVDEADLIHFALKTGFRAGEITSAEWGDIDWTGKSRRRSAANIQTGLRKQPSEWLPEGFRPKGFRSKKSKIRIVEIPSLVERLKTRKKRADDRGDKTTLIFPNGGGRRHKTSSALVGVLQAIAAKSKHDISGDVDLHRFRKTFATDVYDAKKDIYMVQVLLGHSDPETTMRYLGINGVDASAVLGNVFNKYE